MVKMGQVKSILVIDDDQDDYELVNEAIHDIDTSIVVSYADCCEKILDFRHDKFDLILLDINMPYHDGFYFLKVIRKYGPMDLPIIMYTNSLSPKHISRAYADGANLFFSKPESFSGLRKGLNTLVNLDWSNPLAVTKHYCVDGDYKPFQPE